MSLQVRASSAIAVVVTLLIALGGGWSLGAVQWEATPGHADSGIATTFAEVNSPANDAISGEEADQEDAEPASPGRQFQVISTSSDSHVVSTELGRSIRRDRPPRPAHVG